MLLDFSVQSDFCSLRVPLHGYLRLLIPWVPQGLSTLAWVQPHGGCGLPFFLAVTSPLVPGSLILGSHRPLCSAPPWVFLQKNDASFKVNL